MRLRGRRYGRRPRGGLARFGSADPSDGQSGGEPSVRRLGDTAGCASTGNVITVPMDRPRSIRAKFEAIAPLVTKTTPVPVPYTWLEEHHLVYDGDYEGAALAVGMNGRPVWESYVIGLNPLNPDSHFWASIEMVDGKLKVTRSPDLGSERVYKVPGKRKLSDPEWKPREPDHRFFLIEVRMS